MPPASEDTMRPASDRQLKTGRTWARITTGAADKQRVSITLSTVSTPPEMRRPETLS
eukprot:CAMPEP_0175908444 /NCGR_PEP_ID=MMETSP0108-20121206/6592_1 /TAXON_ID=195067 ORGANISM="Goniomonas pacifica, Strain CCMP1869" /NCGR_SAMPLE_ID=MMETSP0108 /ASSEMBLY_ACC=CAM_ASM_000204 /LENGTH=56 /DNA_ID=CAMNT_0017230481 /DNA_START=141 /DNA_END=311 /DNA_ORIENTATION=-